MTWMYGWILEDSWLIKSSLITEDERDACLSADQDQSPTKLKWSYFEDIDDTRGTKIVISWVYL
jgi:hypothetical protein